MNNLSLLSMKPKAGFRSQPERRALSTEDFFSPSCSHRKSLRECALVTSLCLPRPPLETRFKDLPFSVEYARQAGIEAPSLLDLSLIHM